MGIAVTAPVRLPTKNEDDASISEEKERVFKSRPPRNIAVDMSAVRKEATITEQKNFPSITFRCECIFLSISPAEP
jgi:hypothetical protein